MTNFFSQNCQNVYYNICNLCQKPFYNGFGDFKLKSKSMSWILYTIAAATLQTFRNLEQKALNLKLDALTVSWSRFILPLPIAIFIALKSYDIINQKFIFHCLVTALFQVMGNVYLLKTFQSKNFSIGIAFYKTELLQTMLLGLILFNESISFLGFIAIIIATIGVILISGLNFFGTKNDFLASLKNKTAFYGLLSGLFFSISAFNLKFASASLDLLEYSALKASVIVLLWVILFQNILFVLIKSFQGRLTHDLKSLFTSENKIAFLKTSILSFAGSVCWFTAFTLGKVVYVKAVGQLELVLAVILSHYILKERNSKTEMVGMFLTSTGIIMLIFWH